MIEEEGTETVLWCKGKPPYFEQGKAQRNRENAWKLKLRQVKLNLVGIVIGHFAERLPSRIVESTVHVVHSSVSQQAAQEHVGRNG